MPDQEDYLTALKSIVSSDGRYNIEAYVLVQNALSSLLSRLKERRHVSARELLEAIGQYAGREYGPLGREVLEHWGVRKPEDFGEIVFNMIDKGLLKKTAEDRKEDFSGNEDFWASFE
jgi:uncharacterized repeat protein (TIGR04138 family)